MVNSDLAKCFLVPVLPSRISFAILVRRAISEIESQDTEIGGVLCDSDTVLLSLPAVVERSYLDAVGNLPKASVLFLQRKSQVGAEHREILSVNPSEGFTEAARSARERGCRLSSRMLQPILRYFYVIAAMAFHPFLMTELCLLRACPLSWRCILRSWRDRRYAWSRMTFFASSQLLQPFSVLRPHLGELSLFAARRLSWMFKLRLVFQWPKTTTPYYSSL